MADRLPSDLVRFIGLKLDTSGDRIRFRAVSKSWRSALPVRHPPCLMSLSKSKTGVKFVNFVSAGEQIVSKIDFPEIDGVAARHIVGCEGNWLITRARGRCFHLHNSLLLLNPFSKRHLHLPSCSQPDYFVLRWPRKLVLSSLPRSCNGHHFTAVASLWNSTKLAFLRAGHTSWTLLPLHDYPSLHFGCYFEDVIFYKGRFYAITTTGKLFACGTWDDALKPPKLSFVSEYFVGKVRGAGGRKYYLAEWSGQLLMVVRFIYIPDSDDEDDDDDYEYDYDDYEDGEYYDDDDDDEDDVLAFRYKTFDFKMYKFDFVKMKFEVLQCLGDHSLFLGFNGSMSVPASDYFGLVRRNCIYFTGDYVGVKSMKYMKLENDIGVFDLEDNTITPHFKCTSDTLCTRSVWIFPA